jgi:hypothetical protein
VVDATAYRHRVTFAALRVSVPDDAYLNVYFIQGIERIRVQEISPGNGDMVILFGYNPDQEKPATAMTNLSSLTLIFKTEPKAEFESKSRKPEPPKISPRFQGFRPLP